MDTAAFFAAAESAGLLYPCTWTNAGEAVSRSVYFRMPVIDAFDGLAIIPDPYMRYLTTDFVGLKIGDTVEILGNQYKVKEMRPHIDGTECTATLRKA
jgi:hypothetical protein